jgi:hypothetical protein
MPEDKIEWGPKVKRWSTKASSEVIRVLEGKFEEFGARSPYQRRKERLITYLEHRLDSFWAQGNARNCTRQNCRTKQTSNMSRDISRARASEWLKSELKSRTDAFLKRGAPAIRK